MTQSTQLTENLIICEIVSGIQPLGSSLRFFLST